MPQQPPPYDHRHPEGAREDLREDARDLKSTARDQVERRAAQEKDRLSSGARSASSAMESAADDMRRDDDAPEWLASAFSSAARKVDDLARRLQDKDVRELASETRGFARDNPTAFLAASAAVGFAAARFMRAGAEEHDDIPLGSRGDRSQGDPDTTYRTRMTERVGRADPEWGRESAIGGAGSPRASAAPVGSAPSINTRGGTR